MYGKQYQEGHISIIPKKYSVLVKATIKTYPLFENDFH